MTPARTIEELGPATFAFFPAIVAIPSNEWRFKESTWSEVLVTNLASGTEVWIPRQYLGEVTRVDQQLAIVGLKKELEFKAGSIWPHERRVLQLPPEPKGPPNPVPVLPAGPSVHPTDRFATRLIAAVLLGGLALAALTVLLTRQRSTESEFRTIMQMQSNLSFRDDHFAVRRELGEPLADSYTAPTGAVQYRMLVYPSKVAILMGEDRQQMSYIGTVDREGRPLHSVRMSSGEDTEALLKSLKTQLPRP